MIQHSFYAQYLILTIANFIWDQLKFNMHKQISFPCQIQDEYPVTASCGKSSLNLIPMTSESLEDISQNTTSLQKTKNRNGLYEFDV